MLIIISYLLQCYCELYGSRLGQYFVNCYANTLSTKLWPSVENLTFVCFWVPMSHLLPQVEASNVMFISLEGEQKKTLFCAPGDYMTIQLLLHYWNLHFLSITTNYLQSQGIMKSTKLVTEMGQALWRGREEFYSPRSSWGVNVKPQLRQVCRSTLECLGWCKLWFWDPAS